MGFGLKRKVARAVDEIRIKWANTVGRPSLFRSGTSERLGAIYTNPSDMCAPDRVMLYALIRGLRPQRILEIGVRWGGGARIIASALEDAGGPGQAIGIDPAPEAFRPKARDLFGRYKLLTGYSPAAIPEAVARLGGPLDLAIIDAMHTHDHALADFQGVASHLAPGARVLLHDTFHMGIDRAVGQMLEEYPHFVDCGFLTRHPEISDAPVAYQGLRLIRAGTPDSHDIIRGAYQRAGRSAPEFSNDLINWDHYWNKIKDNPQSENRDIAPAEQEKEQEQPA